MKWLIFYVIFYSLTSIDAKSVNNLFGTLFILLSSSSYNILNNIGNHWRSQPSTIQHCLLTLHQHYSLLNQNWRRKKSKQSRKWTADARHIISSRMSWLITTQTITRSGPVPAQLYNRACLVATSTEIIDDLFLTWSYMTVFKTSYLKVWIDRWSMNL